MRGFVRFTKNPSLVRPALIGEKPHIDRHVLGNGFEAVGHAVAQAYDGCFERLSSSGTRLSIAHIRHRKHPLRHNRPNRVEGRPWSYFTVKLNSLPIRCVSAPAAAHLTL